MVEAEAAVRLTAAAAASGPPDQNRDRPEGDVK